MATFTLPYREYKEPQGSSVDISRSRDGTVQARSFNDNLPQIYIFLSAELTETQRDAFQAFWDARKGIFETFTWEGKTVRFLSMDISNHFDVYTVAWSFERVY